MYAEHLYLYLSCVFSFQTQDNEVMSGWNMLISHLINLLFSVFAIICMINNVIVMLIEIYRKFVVSEYGLIFEDLPFLHPWRE